jgi:hypothetical protein
LGGRAFPWSVATARDSPPLLLLSQLSDTCLDEPSHESRWYRLVQSKPNRPLPRGLVSLKIGRKGTRGCLAERVEAAAVFPSGVPDKGLSIETEGGHSVTETLNSAGGCRANGLAQLLDVPTCIGW